jgi:hypothetical protein
MLALLAALTVMAMTLGANAALAGEVTGSGANADQNQGKSWCSFSGLNDVPGNPLDLDITGPGTAYPDGPGGISQSFGQDVKLGADPHEGNPGVACNPSRTFLPPNPNRTH